MATTQKFLAQLEEEAIATRKMLSVVPDDKFTWQPHPKSMTVQHLATHIAEIPGWFTLALNTDGLDVSDKKLDPPAINNQAELLAFFEQKLAQGRNSLQNATDEDLKPNWIMSYGDRVISVRPKEDVIRMSMSQIIHHRAQLGVFLRLLNVPIPGSYGPSADEKGM
jgi:uncharacterized damage-inducible protein DinB